MSRLVAAPHPFKTETIDRIVPDGLTLAEMLTEAQCDPVLAAHAHIWIADHYVPRHLWHRVRPKPGVTITLRVVPHGGGGGGKNPLRTVLTIAVVAAAFAVTGGAAAGVFGESFAAGTIGASVLGGAITIGGSLLINAIAPVRPPSFDGLSGTSTTRDSPTLFIEGARNQSRPFGTVPVVLGVHRNVPPLGVQTYTEVIGDDNYLRMLVVWGYGPLKIEDIKIGETPIANFEGVQIETREGRLSDQQITLIPDVVEQDDFSILLDQASGWQTRSAQPNGDELSVDILFAQGLVQFDGAGARQSISVSVQIQYREIGSGTWLTPTFTAKTNAAVSGDTVTFQHNRTSAIRHGFRWSVASRGDYEIRMRRTTADTDDSQIFDVCHWTAIRTITDEYPIQFPYPLAVTALVVKATDQLNRAIDELNATTSSYVESYSGGSWSEAVSSNPADLYRHVLQGNANAQALPDERVDIDKLEDWYDFCDTNGFEFNMVRDYQASVWDTLADIAAAGRASPAQIDDKWSVVVDEEQTVPVQHFTPRNSWGFEAEKGFPEQPHAFRVRFSNRNEQWRQDERIVYADGYNPANATQFDGLDAPGITDPDHVWKFGRFHLAQAVLRPERWTFYTDFEYIVARRGDLVLITHDVLLVGLASGRIKEVHTGGSPLAITGVTVDETLTMESGNNYGLSIRTVSDVEVTEQIVTSDGDQTTVTFTTPVTLGAIAAGDLFGFGTLGNETIQGLLLSIEPLGELSARLTCIPASPAVYDADTGTIPDFDTKITALPVVPDVVISNVRSDESVLQIGSGITLIPHIAISVIQPNTSLNISLEVQIRASSTGEGYYNAAIDSVQGTDYLIGGVEQGKEYDIRARWRDPNRLPGDWTTVTGHTVIGESNAPDVVIKQGALATLDEVSDADFEAATRRKFQGLPTLLDEDFAGSLADINERWEVMGGGGERAVASGGLFGDQVYQLGNNSGDDFVALMHKQLIPYDPANLYQMSVRARQVTGGGPGNHFGYAGVAADGVTIVTNNGAHHYHAAAGTITLPSSWGDPVIGYTQGNATPGTSGVGTLAIPGKMHADVRYLRVWIAVHYPSATGILELDRVTVKELTGSLAARDSVVTRSTSAPSAPLPDDIWIDTDDGNRQYVYDPVSGWVDVRDAGIAQAISDAAGAQATADGKVTTFVSASAPTADGVGDLWIKTSENNNLYRWSGSVWVDVRDAGIPQALTNAANAQATADGKVTTFYAASAPTAEGVGDLWQSTVNYELRRWSGSAWDLVADITAQKTAAAIVNQGALATLDEVSASEFEAATRYKFQGLPALLDEDFSGTIYEINERWEVMGGGGERAVASGGLFGDQVYQLGNNSGDDFVALMHKQLIPYDPANLYQMSVRARQVLGGGPGNLFGYVGVAADGVTIVTNNGAHHYHTAAGTITLPSYWGDPLVGYTQGSATPGTSSVGTLDNPGKMHADVRYLRVWIAAHSPSATGILQLDRVTVKELSGSLAARDTVGAAQIDNSAVGTVQIAANAVTGHVLSEVTTTRALTVASGTGASPPAFNASTATVVHTLSTVAVGSTSDVIDLTFTVRANVTNFFLRFTGTYIAPDALYVAIRLDGTTIIYQEIWDQAANAQDAQVASPLRIQSDGSFNVPVITDFVTGLSAGNHSFELMIQPVDMHTQYGSGIALTANVTRTTALATVFKR